MFNPTDWNPTERFSGLAKVYSRHRPDYPVAAVDFILARCGLKPGTLLVDVGSGTGISSRQFAARRLWVVGIEPNAEMRAEAERCDPNGPPPEYRPGTAEATGLSEAFADAVLAAQAFHWFDPEPTLREFHRILKPGGWAILLWNERDESDPFTAAYGAVIRTARDALAVETPRKNAGSVLLNHPLFTAALQASFPHGQTLDENGMLGRAFSASYAPQVPAEAEKFAADLRAVFARFQNGGQVVLRYRATATVARRADA